MIINLELSVIRKISILSGLLSRQSPNKLFFFQEKQKIAQTNKYRTDIVCFPNEYVENRLDNTTEYFKISWRTQKEKIDKSCFFKIS